MEFRDPDGAVLFSTADTDGVWLSSLDEPAPEVRTIYVEVPGSDGSLDLTEAVAGRPLYADREVTVGLSIVAATHPDAVRKVADLRQAVHGKAVRLETPDSRALGGYYSGRASMGEVEYPGEAAEVVVTVTARPWVVLGEHTVTLANPGYAAYADGNLGTADAAELPHGIVTVEHFTPDYENGYSNADTVRLATADTLNVIDPSIARWSMWTLSKADWEAAGQSTGWETAWDNWAVQEDLDGLTPHFDTLGGIDVAVRLLLSANCEDYRGIPRNGSADSIGINAAGTVAAVGDHTDAGDTTGKGAAGIEYIHVASTTAPAIAASASSMKPTSGTVRVSEIPGREPSTLHPPDSAAAWRDHAASYSCEGDSPTYADPWNERADQDANLLVANGRPAGYALAMVEVRWTELSDVTVGAFMCPFLPDAYSGLDELAQAPGFSSVAEVSIGHPVYCYNNTTDSIVSDPFSTVYWSRLEGGDTSSPTVRPEPVAEPMTALRPGKAAPYIRAFDRLSGSRGGWQPLDIDVKVPPRATVELDSGDMPSALSVHVPGTAVLDANGESYTMAADGIAPFSAIGSLELGYRLYAETGDGSVTYTEGVL